LKETARTSLVSSSRSTPPVLHCSLAAIVSSTAPVCASRRTSAVVSRSSDESTRHVFASLLKLIMLPSSPYGKLISSRHSLVALSRTRTVDDESSWLMTSASRTSKLSSSVPQPTTLPGFSVSSFSAPVARSQRYMSNFDGSRLLMATSTVSGKRLLVITFCALASGYGVRSRATASGLVASIANR